MKKILFSILVTVLVACNSEQEETGETQEQLVKAPASAPVGLVNRVEPSTDWINLLQNPSFEQGKPPWYAMHDKNPLAWRDFELSSLAVDGSQSALFTMDSEGDVSGGARVWGVVQDFAADTMPRSISGFYRVEDWNLGTEKQYLQVVLMFTIPGGVGGISRDGISPVNIPTQIAWVLAGISEPPFEIGNREFIFLDVGQPPEGEWVYFEIDVRKSLEQAWSFDSEGVEISGLRVFFESRFDGYTEGDGSVAGKVYFDDLRLMTAGSTHN